MRASALRALLAGLGFGLALVTKNQFVLIVPPVLVLLALLDWRYYRAGNWWLRLAPPVIACGCFGVWTLAQFQFFGRGFPLPAACLFGAGAAPQACRAIEI